MSRVSARFAERVQGWQHLARDTATRAEKLLPRMSNWRLLPYFLLLVVMAILFPLFLLVARVIIRRTRHSAASA